MLYKLNIGLEGGFFCVFFLKGSRCKIFVWLYSETFLLAAPSRTTFLFLQRNFKRGEGRPVKTGHLNSVFFFVCVNIHPVNLVNRKQITKVNNWMLQLFSFLNISIMPRSRICFRETLKAATPTESPR